MIIKSLSKENPQTIAPVFTKAFSDYLVKISVTPESLAIKFKQESIDLNWSIGAYDNDKLVGFILHGYRDLNGGLLYNGGTGVIPSSRGHHLTEKMYQWIIPVAKSKGVRQLSLEVIKQNERALYVYKKLGFTIQKELIIYSGTKSTTDVSIPFQIKQLDKLPVATDWWNSQPSWPGKSESLQQIEGELFIAGAFTNKELIGYIAVLKTGRLFQLVVHPQFRKKKIAFALLQFCFSHLQPETFIAINIDSRDTETNNFFTSIGWKEVVRQFEMTLDI